MMDNFKIYDTNIIIQLDQLESFYEAEFCQRSNRSQFLSGKTLHILLDLLPEDVSGRVEYGLLGMVPDDASSLHQHVGVNGVTHIFLELRQ